MSEAVDPKTKSTTIAELKERSEKSGFTTLMTKQKDGGWCIYFHPDETDHIGNGMTAILKIMEEKNK
jgi:hypothetical protein